MKNGVSKWEMDIHKLQMDFDVVLRHSMTHKVHKLIVTPSVRLCFFSNLLAYSLEKNQATTLHVPWLFHPCFNGQSCF